VEGKDECFHLEVWKADLQGSAARLLHHGVFVLDARNVLTQEKRYDFGRSLFGRGGFQAVRHSGILSHNPAIGGYHGRMRPLEGLTTESRLALVCAKVERAKQNLIDMQISLDKFHGYVPGAKRKVSSFKRPSGLIPTYDVPFDTLCAAGDVIGNLVGAFDHLSYQLIMAFAPNTPEEVLRSVYFPLAHDRADYKSRMKTIKELIHPGAVELIKAIKPYAGGNEALGLLHKLNNVSKHRLILNVAQHVVCYGPGGRESAPFIYILDDVYFLGIWGRPQVDDYVLETGLETISEIGPEQPEALLPTLHYLVAVVDA
jgi:hypothetical protein